MYASTWRLRGNIAVQLHRQVLTDCACHQVLSAVYVILVAGRRSLAYGSSLTALVEPMLMRRHLQVLIRNTPLDRLLLCRRGGRVKRSLPWELLLCLPPHADSLGSAP